MSDFHAPECWGFFDDILKKPSASGGIVPRLLPGDLPLDPSGGLLPPDPPHHFPPFSLFPSPMSAYRSYQLHFFIPLSVTLTFAGCHKVSTKAEPVGFLFLHTFQLIRMKLDVVLKHYKLSEIFLIKGIYCCFTDCTEKLMLACTWTFLSNFVKIWYNDRYC